MIKTNKLLDPEFAEGGIFTPPSPITSVHASLKTTKGRIFAASTSGEFALFRLDQNNLLDKHFGSNGTGLVTGTFKEEYLSRSEHLLALDNDRLLLVGSTTDNTFYGSRAALACFTNDGVLDDQFGSNGFVVIEPTELVPGTPPAPPRVRAPDLFNSQQSVEAPKHAAKVTAHGADGSFYVLANDSRGGLAIILKYLRNGKLDLSFNKTGYRYLIRSALDFSHATTLHVDETCILVGGHLQQGLEGNVNALAIKLTHDGEYDKTFGEKGFGFFTDQLTSLADFVVLPDKSLVACGNGPSLQNLLVALTPCGEIDESFDSSPLNPGGSVKWECITYSDQPSPNLVPIGVLSKDNNFPMLIARYDTKGRIDLSFAEDGYGTVTVQRFTLPLGCERDDTGAVLACGIAQLDSPTQPFVVRLRTNQ